VLVLVALDNMGVDITALVAGLGVGGVAVALATQNILGDLFASVSILLDKPFVPGDFIVVGEFMGTVEHVGIKTTRVRSLSGEQIVFSNADLLQSRLRNHKRMYERRVVFMVKVLYQTPTEKLEAIPRLLREMVESHGAGGIKVHPVVQRFMPDDPRMGAIYRTCVEFGVPVLSHAGSAKANARFADPASFAPVLEAFPDLTLVLAHLGGARWSQTAEFARAFPQVTFDLSEIVEWTGAPNAPTREDLARLIRDVGPARVMLGTDFPWYDLGRTVDLVMDLPLLATEEKEAILGMNAARILRLPL